MNYNTSQMDPKPQRTSSFQIQESQRYPNLDIQHIP